METDQHTRVAETITRFVEEELLFRRPGVEVDADTNLVERGIVDSVGLFRVVGFLEESFELSIPPDAIVPENLGSIAAMTGYVLDHMEQG
jgi:acyl carrier protein